VDLQERVGGQGEELIHLVKLAVGVRDVAHLDALQHERSAREPALRHRTRNTPKRAAELCDGGSIYWVINRAILVRQRITGIIRDNWEDGSACAGILLAPELVRVAPRPMKPFQGWRYLPAADAPADLDGNAADGLDELPDEMRLALTHLALL